MTQDGLDILGVLNSSIRQSDGEVDVQFSSVMGESVRRFWHAMAVRWARAVRRGHEETGEISLDS